MKLNNKVEHPEIIANILINSIQQAWDQTMDKYFITETEYINKQKNELKESFNELESINKYYADLETYIKKGYKIPQRVYNSLIEEQKNHFNKHYSNKII